jgi:hypothetical protein
MNGVVDEAGYLAVCSAVSNATLGTVINPVQSARLSTRNSVGIRFGRAKMPNGYAFFIWVRSDTIYRLLLKQGLGG